MNEGTWNQRLGLDIRTLLRTIEKLLESSFELPHFAVMHGDLLQDLCLLQLGFQYFLLIALAHAIPRFDNLLHIFQQLLIAFQDR